MSDKKKQVLDIFEKLLPQMSDMDIEKLLAFGEGMAFKANLQQIQKADQQHTVQSSA